MGRTGACQSVNTMAGQHGSKHRRTGSTGTGVVARLGFSTAENGCLRGIWTGTPREGANATVACRRPRVRVRQRQNPVYKQRVETNKHTAVLTDTVASPQVVVVDEVVLGSPTSQGMLQDGRAAAPSKRFRVSKTEP